MRRVVVFSDIIDHEDDVKSIVIAAQFNDVKIDLKETTIVQDLETLATPNSTVFVDYGALSFGASGLVDHIERYIEELIINRPSVTFVYVLTMGREYYKDSIFEHLNVVTIDRSASLADYKPYLEEI
jgi:hypothetical protein